jgi:hypothetical protein
MNPEREAGLTDAETVSQLRQQLLLAEFALEHAHEAVYLVDASQRLIYVNAEACRA